MRSSAGERTTRPRDPQGGSSVRLVPNEVPSMEPAFGGVKSNEMLTLHLLAGGEPPRHSGLSGQFVRSIFGDMNHDDARRLSFFRFLRRLRAGGRTNMYGAVPYLMKAFDLDRVSAFAVVCEGLDRQNDPQEVEPEAPARRRRFSSASQS